MPILMIERSLFPLLSMTLKCPARITVFQLPTEEDICFRDYEFTRTIAKNLGDASYVPVCTVLLPTEKGVTSVGKALENVYAALNIGCAPGDHFVPLYDKIRSMSVSDIALLQADDCHGAFYCDSFGFVQLDSETESAITAKLPATGGESR